MTDVQVDPLPALPSNLSGEGRLDYADGRTTSCSFQASYEENGEFWLLCEHDQSGWVFAEPELSPPCRFAATLADGKVLTAEGDFMEVTDLLDCPQQTRSVQVRYRVTNGPGVRITNPGGAVGGPLRVHFALLNLSFSGTISTRYKSGERRDLLPLRLAGREFALIRAKNFDSGVKKLKTNHQAGITASIYTTVADASEIEGLTQDVTRLCSLLTLATGGKVVWPFYIAQFLSGDQHSSQMISPPVRGFSTFELIDERDGATVKGFLESTFDTYVAKQADYELARVIDARVDAISGGFLETKTLMAGVLTDFVTGRFAVKHVHSAKTFRERLEFMVSKVCPDVDAATIAECVKTRNHLAHRMRFRTAKGPTEYRAVMHVVNRLLLGLLGYQGPYVDCRTWKIVNS